MVYDRKVGEKKMEQKEKNSNRIPIPISLVILCLVVLCFSIGIEIKEHRKQKMAPIAPSESLAEVKAKEPEKKGWIPDTTTVYKKQEKDIKIPVLIYHAFSTEPQQDPYQLFVTPGRFEEQITALINDGYTFITLDELVAYQKEEIGLPEKVVLITIDDGWKGNYIDVFPLLKKYDIPATIFIVNDLLGKEGYFTWEEAKEMFDSGLVKIHSHGKRHIDYSQVTKEVLQQNLEASQQQIEEKLGKQVPRYFAYPSGKHTVNSVAWLKEIGFDVQVMTRYGYVNRSKDLDLTNIGRIRCEEKTTGEHILNVIRNAKLVP